jgi:hypothetical protein
MKIGNCYLCKRRHIGSPLYEVSFGIHVCKYCCASATVGDVIHIVKSLEPKKIKTVIENIFYTNDKLDNHTANRTIQANNKKA